MCAYTVHRTLYIYSICVYVITFAVRKLWIIYIFLHKLFCYSAQGFSIWKCCCQHWRHHGVIVFSSVAEPKLFNFGSGSNFPVILAPAPAPAPAPVLYCHLKNGKFVWFNKIKTVLKSNIVRNISQW